MPSYTHRKDEALAFLDELAPHINPGEVDRIRPLIAPIYDGRDSVLTAFLTVAQADDKREFAGDWKTMAATAGERVVNPLSHLLDGATEKSEVLRVWCEEQSTRESLFFRTLDFVGVAEARDALIKIEADLAKLIQDLQAKWDTMSASARALEALEQEASTRLGAIIQKSVSDGTVAWARYGDRLKKLGDKVATTKTLINEAVVYIAKEAGWPDLLAETVPKMSDVGKDYFAKGKELGIDAKTLSALNPELFRDPGMAITEEMQKGLGQEVEYFIEGLKYFYKEVLPIATEEYDRQLDNFQRALPNQGVVVVSLGQTRRDVDEFLKNAGLDKARTIFDKLDSALESWVAGVRTDGQRQDAKAWADEIMEAFKKKIERISDAFGVFVQANQGRFIGTPSKATENELIFTDVWVDREQRLLDIGMDARIKEWRSGLSVISDAAETASSQAFAELRYLPRDISDKIIRAVNDYWSKVRERIRQESLIATETLDKADAKVEPSALDKSISRRELKDKLVA